MEHVKDRRHYAKVYSELIEANENFDNYKLLGDALMRIQEPEEASTAYTKALTFKDDEKTIKLLGKALCKTHDYVKA